MQHSLGDLVRIGSPKFPGVYRIIKINSVNIKVESVDNPLRRVNVNPVFLLGVDETPKPPVNLLTAEHRFVLGEIVHVKGKGDIKWVVIKIGYDKINVAKLGGDNDRYLRCPIAILSPWSE